MINTILSDFSRVILNPRDKNYQGGLNDLYQELKRAKSSFNLYDYFEFNEKILNLYKSLKTTYSINLFTTEFIQNDPEIKKRLDSIFENVFTAADYSINKQDPDAYLFIAKKLDKRPKEILYIDDQQINIEAAKKAGILTVHFKDYANLLRQIKNILGKTKVKL